MLKFKEYLQAEENTVGRHNDGAGPFNSRTGAIQSSDQDGSEYLEKNRGLPSTDLVVQSLPKQEIKGKILGIFDKKDPCEIRIWTDEGMIIHKIPFDNLKNITGYIDSESSKGKNISLVSQGYVNGLLHIRYGTIS